MYIGVDPGCNDVPDPIAPIDIRLLSLDPTLIPMSSQFITISGPIFIFIPLMSPIFPSAGMLCISCFCDAGEGLACGICMPGMLFMSICCCGVGDACGESEGVGLICIPGILPMSICPGVAGGDGDGVGDGPMSIPFISSCLGFAV